MSDANIAAVAYAAETSFGVQPAPNNMTATRFKKDALNWTKQTLVSEEIRADRNVPDLIMVGYQPSGNLDFELSATAFDPFLQSGLFVNSVPAGVNITALSVTSSAAAGTLTRASGSFITDGIIVGTWIKLVGSTGAADDGPHKVTTVAALSITLDGGGASVLTVTGSYSATITNKKVFRNGQTRSSFELEKNLNATSWIQFLGMVVGTMRFTFTAKQIAQGTMTFNGLTANARNTSSAAGAYTAAPTNPVMSCSANVGKLQENSAAISTGCREIMLNVNNNLRMLDVVGQAGVYDIGVGRFEVTGTVTLFFKDIAILQRFIAHTASNLSWVVTDGSGNSICFDIPKLQFARGTTDITGINTDVMLPFDFEGILDPVTNCTLQICTL